MSSSIKSYFSQLFYGKRSEISGPHEKYRICFCGKTSSGSVEWYLIDVSVEKACLSGKTESSIKKLTPISVAKHFPSVYYAALGGRIYSLGGQRRSVGGGETLLNDVLILDLNSLDGFSAHSPAALAHWKPAPAVSGEDQGMKYVLTENLKPALVADEDEDEDDEDWKSTRANWKSARANWKSGPVDSFNKHIEYMKSVLSDEDSCRSLLQRRWLRFVGTVSDEDQDMNSALSGVDWRAKHRKAICDEALARIRVVRRLVLRDEEWNSGTVSDEDQEDPDMKSALSAANWHVEYFKSVSDKASAHRREDRLLAFRHLCAGIYLQKRISPPRYDSFMKNYNSFWKRELKTSISALALASEDLKPDTGKALRSLYWNSRSISALSLTDFYSEYIHALLLGGYMKSLTLSDGNWKPVSGKERRGVDWKPGPPMTFARCNPHTMVVDDKLYVIGGFKPNKKQADGWIEFFDPEEEKWESLPSPPDLIHSSVMLSGLLKAKKEIIIARQRWDRHPLVFYSYNIITRSWKMLVLPESKVSVCLPPNIGRAVTVDNTLYWISTEEHNHECIIHSYDLDKNMWFEDRLNTATIFGRHEHFSSIYSSGPGFLHLRDKKFCLLLQSTVSKNDPQSSIQYLYCVILDISPISEDEDRGKFELTTLSVQKYSMDHYINFLDCMLVYGKSCEDDRQVITDGRCSTYGLYLYKIVEQYSLQSKKRKASPKPMVKMK